VISEGVVGAALGALFLWNGSLLVPFAAHTVLQAQVLLVAVAAAPDSIPGALSRRPFATCPACGARLSLQHVNHRIHEAFLCPKCGTRLTTSDHWRGFFRWGLLIVYIFVFFVSWEIFPELLKGSNYLVSTIVYGLSTIGLSSILVLVFRPKLEFGDPDFVSLNLGDHDRIVPTQNEPANQPKAESK
jgi:predicted RNA-binding Zn-ribbon protein involved in translation (DUF1610 family)